MLPPSYFLPILSPVKLGVCTTCRRVTSWILNETSWNLYSSAVFIEFSLRLAQVTHLGPVPLTGPLSFLLADAAGGSRSFGVYPAWGPDLYFSVFSFLAGLFCRCLSPLRTMSAWFLPKTNYCVKSRVKQIINACGYFKKNMHWDLLNLFRSFLQQLFITGCRRSNYPCHVQASLHHGGSGCSDCVSSWNATTTHETKAPSVQTKLKSELHKWHLWWAVLELPDSTYWWIFITYSLNKLSKNQPVVFFIYYFISVQRCCHIKFCNDYCFYYLVGMKRYISLSLQCTYMTALHVCYSRELSNSFSFF